MPLQGLSSVRVAMDKSKSNLNDKLRVVYFKGLRGMIKPTPVDSGRVRNNWFLTVGAASGLTERSASKSGGGSIRSLSAMPKNILNSKVYFTNNMPYASTLEYGGYSQPGTDKTSNGFSIQAPDGWVRKGLQDMRKNIRSL
jgi:hypothetical protein